MTRIVGWMALALALVVGASIEQAAEFPRQPIRIIVPFAPGASGDTVTRLVAEELHASLGQPVLVENQSGATGRVGVGNLARAPADGYVIGMGNESTHITLPLKGHTAYDPERDFTPLSLVARVTMAVAVNPDLLPVTTVPELLAQARKQPVAFGSPGEGSLQHVIGLMLAQRGGGRFQHVPQPGAAATARELAEGRLPMAVTTLSALLAHPGKVRILAIADAARNDRVPEVPTLRELWPDFVVTGWIAFFAPAGIPPSAAERLTQALQAALHKPALVAALRRQALEPVGGSGPELGDLVRTGIAAWRAQMRGPAAD